MGLPKTVYFNFKYFKIEDAIKLPILVSHRVYLSECEGSLKIEAPTKFGMIRIGYGDVGIFDQHKSRSIWKVSGNVIFKGKAHIGHGSKLSVSGILTLGSNFSIAAESQIICQKEILFGHDVLVSWENLFMDTDFHKIITDGEITNLPREIHIGNHVWIGCRCTILKGTKLGDDIIIAANSTISGVYNEPNTIVGGNPATIIKRGINWEL